MSLPSYTHRRLDSREMMQGSRKLRLSTSASTLQTVQLYNIPNALNDGRFFKQTVIGGFYHLFRQHQKIPLRSNCAQKNSDDVPQFLRQLKDIYIYIRREKFQRCTTVATCVPMIIVAGLNVMCVSQDVCNGESSDATRGHPFLFIRNNTPKSS